MKHFFHSLILLFVILVFGFFANAAEDFTCHIAKVTTSSSTPMTAELRGNAFAISANRLVLNDHSLPQNFREIQLSFNDSKIGYTTGRLIARDFHTDLAMIEISGNVLTPCQLAPPNSELRRQSEVLIEGFENQSGRTTLQKAVLINSDSRAMTVPGIRSALEFSGERGNILAMRNSLSGGPVFSGNPAKVYGMITQVTPEGTSLAIPSKDIYNFAKSVFAGTLPVRRYNFDRDTQTFELDGGLQFKGVDQVKKNAAGGVHEGARNGAGGGTVHEGNGGGGSGGGAGGGTVHEGNGGGPHEAIRMFMKTGGIYSPGQENNFVSLKSLDLGYAIATVSNKTALITRQPILADLFKRSNVKTIFIRSVDGVRVKNLFELVRELGECTRCLIDNFYVDVETDSTKSTNILSSLVLISRLLDSFSETKKSDPTFVAEMTDTFDSVIRNLNNFLEDAYAGQGISMKKYDDLMLAWNAAEKRMRGIFLTDLEDELLLEIRGIFAAHKRILSK